MSPNRHPPDALQEATRRMICGGLAGMIAKTATNPLDRLRMLQQTGETGAGASGVVRVFSQVLQREGIAGLWAGNGANLLRVFPAKAVVFSSQDFYKSQIRHVVPSWSTSFLAGGLAGMTATAVTYPLDLARGRISGKLGAAKGQKAYSGILATLKRTIQEEGWRALYRGVTPTLLGAMPYEGIKFGTVGLLERLFPPAPQLHDQPPQKSPARKMLFGGAGGVAAGLLTYPNDTVRRLLQLQGSAGTSTAYKGYWDCVRHTFRTAGLARFYRGVGLNLIRMAPNTAVQFGSYELLKDLTAPR